MVFQPIPELLAYLRENGFKTYISSGVRASSCVSLRSAFIREKGKAINKQVQARFTKMATAIIKQNQEVFNGVENHFVELHVRRPRGGAYVHFVSNHRLAHAGGAFPRRVEEGQCCGVNLHRRPLRVDCHHHRRSTEMKQVLIKL